MDKFYCAIIPIANKDGYIWGNGPSNIAFSDDLTVLNALNPMTIYTIWKQDLLSDAEYAERLKGIDHRIPSMAKEWLFLTDLSNINSKS